MIRAMRKSLLLTLSLGAAAATVSAQPVRGSSAEASRPALEQQFRQRLAKLAQTRIGLTDAQMAQLEQSTARYAPQLSDLATQERETRRQLRVELTATQPNQQHVSDLLDASLRLQKQRIALIEAEQKDLARFMTPVQRARYIALQQQFRRRTQELTAKRGGSQRPGAQRPGGKRLP
jgi:Spy/CpxP family protein refolding chaperone